MPSLSEARSPGARPLDAAEQQVLLQYAREAISEAVSHRGLPPILRHDGIFAERCGVFVTLHVRQRLRGCIGVVETDESLGSSLVRCAASAALTDSRFPPLRHEELPDLRIEISLLSPPEPTRPDQIEIGRHGLLITSAAADPPFASNDESSATSSSCAPPSVSEGGSAIKRGLLLPQVAVEHHFTREQFLAETCRKAGLPPEAWRLSAEARHSTAPGHADSSLADTCLVQLLAFTCQVFSEDEKRSPCDS